MRSFHLFTDETLVLRLRIVDENNSIYLPSEANINLSYRSDCGIGKFFEDTENKYVYFLFKPNVSEREIGFLSLHIQGPARIGDEVIEYHDTEKIYLLFKNASV